MIMRRGQPLLLPASPLFIWSSLAMALLLNITLNMTAWGSKAWAPDLLALVLVFWNVHQPRRVGVGVGFALGLVLDVHQGALLGQHALAYTVLSYFAVSIHRRLLWFTLPIQALQVLPLLACSHALQWVVRLIEGSTLPGYALVLAPLLEALLWPLAHALLLAPQRRAPDPDENRPL